MKKIHEKFKKINRILKVVKIYVIMIFGVFIAATGLSMFLVPAGINAGGVSGIATILHKLFGMHTGIAIFIMNIPIFIAAKKGLGGKFLIKSLICTFLFSAFTDLMAFITPITDNLLLASVFGGVLLGGGMGMVLLCGASTGGSDIIARLVNNAFPAFDVGKCIFATDAVIIIAGAVFLKSTELMLCSITALFVSSFVIDYFLQGANSARAAFVISDKSELIANAVMCDMRRGVSGISVTGMYSNAQRRMLMCIMKKYELSKFKQIVMSCDSEAFIIFMGAHEVSGEGFNIYPIN